MHKRPLYALRQRLLRGVGAALVWVCAAGGLAPGAEGLGGQGAVGLETPCAPCLRVSLRPGETLVLPRDLAGAQLLIRVGPAAPSSTWSDALASVRARGGRAGLHVTGIPADDDPLLTAPVSTFAFEVQGSLSPEGVLALKRSLTRARGEHAEARLLLLADDTVKAQLEANGLEPYADAILPPPRRLEDLRLALARADGAVWLLDGDVVRAREHLQEIATLQRVFGEGLAAVPDRAIACAGTALPTFINPRTLDLVAYGVCASRSAVVSDTPGAPVDVVHLAGWDAVRVQGSSDTRFAEGVSIAGARDLTVGEIVARHQAFAARQHAAIRTRISTGALTVTFEAPGFPAPVTITSRTILYAAPDRTELQQQEIHVNGVAYVANGGVPRLPIIEPERVASPPLAITLTRVYQYRLEGREPVRGHPAYRIAFSPSDARQALFAGRVWIDAASFAIVRIAATQTALRGPITASEQTDDFEPDPNGRWLLTRSDVRQTYEGASVRTPIHRLLTIDGNEIDAPDFTARLHAAYASRDVMLRDTPNGFRYLRRETAMGADTGPGIATVPHIVVAGGADRVRTVAFGVIVDPDISVPLPFAGVSYVDFNLFGTGTQLNGFFGGSYGQLAFSDPSIHGTRWQMGGRAFGIATSYNDRAFERGREIYSQDITQRPASAAVWLLRPISPRALLRVEYDWDYTRFGRADATAADFLVPANQVAHGLRLGVDLQRAGWQASLWWNPTRRTGWRAWGDQARCQLPGGDGEEVCFRPSDRDFQRYGANVLRSMALSPRVATRLEVAAMGGHDLDRFSRYAFGTFDNRLHGYPSALVRYDRGAVLRTAIAWSAAKALRLDGFADTAEVHDPGFGRAARNYTGFGGALEAPAPFGTLVAVEWSYGLQGIDPQGRKGTQVIRISGYKVF